MSTFPPGSADSPEEAEGGAAPAPPAAPGPLPQSRPPEQPVPGLEPPPPTERLWGPAQLGQAPGVAVTVAPAGGGPNVSPGVPGGMPSWAAWQGLLGLFSWVAGSFVVGSIVVVGAAAAGITSLDTDNLPPGILIAATVATDLVFLAVPLGFAALTARPRLWHFGLRRTRVWPTIGWAVLALFGWFVFSVSYEALVNPPGKQSTADDLGVNRSTTLLVVGGFVVIVLAPIVEEFFFRGFIYRTLRNSLVGVAGLRAGIVLAAVIDGFIFGGIHATNTPIAILPVLAVLGFAFCLVYERTGSLFAVIALHATVNTLGYIGAAKNSAPVALFFGVAMILACILLPRLIPREQQSHEGAAPA